MKNRTNPFDIMSEALEETSEEYIIRVVIADATKNTVKVMTIGSIEDGTFKDIEEKIISYQIEDFNKRYNISEENLTTETTH